jgi:hypothetical protein
MVDELSKNILATIVYYDVLDYPLTSSEIWKYLSVRSGEMSGCNFLDVLKELEDDKLRKVIVECRGFYFLKGRESLVNARIKRNKIAQKKFRIARRVAWFLRFVPYVRMVAVTGRLAMKNTGMPSDIDFLIVLKHGRIFIGRILVTLVVHLLGKRRYGDKIADRICLNYFITDQSLEIGFKDLFSSSEYSFIFPLFGFEVFRKFQAKNEWIKNHKPNHNPDSIGNLKIIADSQIAKFIRGGGEKMLDSDRLEKKLKDWQVKRIMSDPRTHELGSIINADNESLVFLPEPQGPEVFEKFINRLGEMSSTLRPGLD